MCNISSACVNVPKTIFIDEKVRGEGGSVKAGVCVEKERDTVRAIQADDESGSLYIYTGHDSV